MPFFRSYFSIRSQYRLLDSPGSGIWYSGRSCGIYGKLWPERQDEGPVSLMRGANIGRSYSSPFRIEPERGKFAEDSSACWKSEHWRDVFNKDPSGLNFANDSNVLKPESAPLSVDSGLSAGDGQVLARESSNDAIHSATPRDAVKGSNVGPDRSLAQAAVFHTRRQDCGRRSFPLHEADRASAWNCASDGGVEHSGPAE